jgi:hypothetical protein
VTPSAPQGSVAFTGDFETGNVHLLRRQKLQLPVGAGRQSVDVEARRLVVPDAHDRRRRRDDLQAAAGADPIDMTMAMHHDGAARERIESADEPAAIDESGSHALRECRHRHGILQHMVVQGDHPQGPRKPGSRRSQAAGLLGRDQAEGVCEGKVCLGIRVQ